MVNQQQTLEAFLAAKAEFDAPVVELHAMNTKHFGANPEAVLWGHPTTLTDWIRRLRNVTAAYRRRGEFAPG